MYTGETIYKFLNHIQKVGYKLNPFIVGVAETLWARGIELGSFILIVNHELPPKLLILRRTKTPARTTGGEQQRQ